MTHFGDGEQAGLFSLQARKKKKKWNNFYCDFYVGRFRPPLDDTSSIRCPGAGFSSAVLLEAVVKAEEEDSRAFLPS